MIRNNDTTNYDFFSKDTEESFYWAGFIAADGCVYSKKSKYSILKTLDINLSINDRDHLEKFKLALNSSKKLYIKNQGKNISFYIAKKFNPIYDDLLRFGITERKTHTYNMPQWLINHPLVRHFIRGTFDGDGGFYLNNKEKYLQMRSRMTGTMPFLINFKYILEKNCNYSSASKPYMYNGTGSLNFSGNLRCALIGSYMYDNSNVFMMRKFNQYLKAKDLVKPKYLGLVKEKHGKK